MAEIALCFDLGKVLLDPCWHIAAAQAVRQALDIDLPPAAIRSGVITFLNAISPKGASTGALLPGELQSPHHINQIVCGLRANHSVLADVLHTASSFPFSPPMTAKVMETALPFLFSPDLFSAHTYAIPDGLALLQRCCELPRVRLFILSNWDPESFQYLLQREDLKDMFSRFSGRAVSGELHVMKPCREIFIEMRRVCEEVLQRERGVVEGAGKGDRDTLYVFIDDREENLKAAEEFGFASVLCERLDFQRVRARLTELGVLPAE